MKILEINSTDVKLNEIENAGQNFDSVYALDIDDIAEDKVSGFVGKAFIYKEEVFVNTFTGEGYDVVVKKMKNYIDWYSGKIRLAGFDREDIKQLIVVLLLDGIRRYNPHKKIKLSTFLYVHIQNRIISRIKEETRQSLNATYNAPLFKFICPCGASFIANNDDGLKSSCKACKTTVNETLLTRHWVIRPEHCEPISLDGIMSSMNDEESNDKASRIHYSGRQNNLIDFFGKIGTVEDTERDLDFASMLSDEDETTRKIAELMYHEDYSITDAAEEVGLTCWAASLRLKKLKNKKHIREFFLSG